MVLLQFITLVVVVAGYTGQTNPGIWWLYPFHQVVKVDKVVMVGATIVEVVEQQPGGDGQANKGGRWWREAILFSTYLVVLVVKE
jgi:hypothetical protein